MVMGRIAAIDDVRTESLVAGLADDARWAYTREQRLGIRPDIPSHNTVVEGAWASDPHVDEVSLERRFAERSEIRSEPEPLQAPAATEPMPGEPGMAALVGDPTLDARIEQVLEDREAKEEAERRLRRAQQREEFLTARVARYAEQLGLDDYQTGEMKRILGDIQDGTFAKNFVAECDAGKPEMNKIRERDRGHKIEEVGKGLRSMFSWLKAA